jgi:signal transduction histidine kinase
VAESGRTRRLRSGIRVRTTATAVAIVGLVLLGAAVAMVSFVTASVRAQVSDEAEIRATQIADAPITPGSSIPVGDPKEEFVQVLSDGSVVASSANARGMAPVGFTPGSLSDVGHVPFAAGPWAAFGVHAPGGRVVIVGRSIDDVVEVRDRVVTALFAGVPAVMVVVGLVTWWLVGRTLRPVEDIRSEVERISAEDLQRRVPEPTSADEIARLAGTMNAMLGRLEDARDRQRRFVSDASHELRTPVASIKQHAEVAAEHPTGTTVEELARRVLSEDARLEALVGDLLLLARLDEGAAGSVEEVDLDDIVLAEAERLRAEGSLVVDTAAVSAARVMGSEQQLSRLVRNMVTNAAQHARGRIAVELRSDGTAVDLSVDDDGPGVPTEDRERIFERFVRLDGARGRLDGGSGLGLAIVREVARAHGGDAEVTDGTLRGARVRVRLLAVPGVQSAPS